MANLNVKVGLDRSGFQTGLAAMENAVQGFGGKVSGILAGSFSLAAIGAGISRAIDKGDQLQDLANRFGVAASAIQEIGNAASLSGGSVEDVAAAMNKLARNAGEAVGGNKQMAESFAKIGLSTQELMGMSPQDLFFALSRAVSSGALGMSDFAVAQDLAGRGAATLMETLRMGPDVIQANGRAMGVWSDETIAALSRASDQIKSLQNVLTIGFGAMVGPIMSILKPLGDVTAGFALFGAGVKEAFSGNFDLANRLFDQVLEVRKNRLAEEAGQNASAGGVRNLDGVVAGSGLEAENKKLAEDTDTFLRNLQIEREVDEIRRARNLERTRQQLKEETAQRERELAEENSQAFARIEDIRAERSGPAAELALLQSRASGAADLARQTGSIQDTLAAEQAALALQNALQGRLQGLGFTNDEAAADARQRTAAAVGNLPQFSDTARAMEMNANNRPVQEPTVKDIASKMGETLDKLDELIRKTEGGVFTL